MLSPRSSSVVLPVPAPASGPHSNARHRTPVARPGGIGRHADTEMPVAYGRPRGGIQEWVALPMEPPRSPRSSWGSEVDGVRLSGRTAVPGPRRKDDAQRRRCRPPTGQLQGLRAHPGHAVGPVRDPRCGPLRGGPPLPPEEAISDITGRDPDLPPLRLELAEIAAGTTTLQQRAQAVLERLGQILPVDAAWLAVRDPERRRHTPLATTGLAEPLRRYFLTPEADAEVDQLDLNRWRPPMLVSEIPLPLPELRAWAEHLLPAGIRGGLAAGLFTATGRHVGFLSLLSEDPHRPDRIHRRLVAAVTSVVADELDRTGRISETARIVEAAAAGVVLTRGGDTLTLPGLPDHRLLTRGSPILTTAAGELADTRAHISFLAPLPGCDREPLVRVTAFDCAVPDLDHLSAAVLLSAPGDLRGLETLDPRVLGLLIDGTTSIPAIAAALGVGAARVADALGAALVALSAPNLTAAAVRALRAGLRIPPPLATTGPATTD